MAPIPILERLSDRTDPTEAWLCDIWGVMHNGEAAFPDAVAACCRFRGEGGIVILVSNAPRPHHAVARQLAALGIDASCYDAIVSSGDVTREALKAQRATPMLHVGPARDHGIFEDLDLDVVAEAHAKLLLCTGLFDDTTETPETYRASFTRLVARGVPMICANPDIKVERGDRVIWCAGGLAALYEDLGGVVTYCGKPHMGIYDAAFATIDRLKRRPVPRARIVAIGDGINTDIKGAAAAGIPSVYIRSAIHMPEPLTPATLAALFAPLPMRPAAALAALAY
jgi:HAD superfamily hydrolase (TIGR01459 family)